MRICLSENGQPIADSKDGLMDNNNTVVVVVKLYLRELFGDGTHYKTNDAGDDHCQHERG
jgi:hypothetical protein